MRGSAQDMFATSSLLLSRSPPQQLHDVTIEDKEASKPQEYPSEDLNLEMTCVPSATHGMCCSLARHYRGSIRSGSVRVTNRSLESTWGLGT